MAIAGLVSVEEYLATDYSPDCDYVEGVLEDRNVGEIDHGSLQSAIVAYLNNRKKELGIWVLSDTRLQIGRDRFRVPDISVTFGKPAGRYMTEAPFLCIEILSPEDRAHRVQVKVREYLKLGVRYVWVVDPQTREGVIYTSEAYYPTKEGVLWTENPRITFNLAELEF